jgi:hypothetical protein
MLEWLNKNKWLIIIIIIFGLFCRCNVSQDYNFFPNEFRTLKRLEEAFRGNKSCTNCPTPSFSDQMCHTMAKDNCRIPTWQMNDCWLNHYRKCTQSCGSSNGNTANCNCHQAATEACRSNDDPAEACYASVHQKCMAGMHSHIKDPDRG